MTKRNFVESLPSLSAREVVAEARRGGMQISTAYVYMVRGPRRSTPARGRPVPIATNQESLESNFIDIALELGLRRAEDLLATVRTKLRQSIK